MKGRGTRTRETQYNRGMTAHSAKRVKSPSRTHSIRSVRNAFPTKTAKTKQKKSH
jgi:hypothetical protein